MRLLPEPTPRLKFRPFRREDLENVRVLFADPYARRFYPKLARERELKAFILRQQSRYRLHGHGLWVLELREDGRFAGDCGLTVQPTDGEDLIEVGYHIVEPLRGRGLATEAARACLDLAFRSLPVDRVGSLVDVENVASRKVAGRVHPERRELGRPGRSQLLYYTTRAAWEARGGSAAASRPAPDDGAGGNRSGG